MTKWTELFGAGPVVVDGGLSTQLDRLGEEISGTLWTGRVLLENPAAITRAHVAFISAGADVVITSSYQVSRIGFIEAGLTSADADAALRASTRAARDAVFAADGRTVRVAASVGPYGAILHDGSEYRGRYGRTRQQLADFHRERLDVLVSTGPDLLAIETIPDVEEAEALVEALADYGEVPAWMSFSAVDGGHVCGGQRIEEAVAIAASSASVMAVGINCSDPQYVTELVTRMRSSTLLPIVVYPNAGGFWDASDGIWHGDVPADPASAFPAPLLAEWRAAGAVAIGGCCGTDATAITGIAQSLRR